MDFANAALPGFGCSEGMGLPDISNPILGVTYVELNEVQQKVWHPDEHQDVVHVVVLADGREKILDKPLRELLGVNFFTWTFRAATSKRPTGTLTAPATSSESRTRILNVSRRWSRTASSAATA